jgi:xanthosine utilization system XapX-like protein
MRGMRRDVLAGIAAGAAGTTALNAVTYLDMVVRARPASSTPEQTVRRAEELTGVRLAADPDGEPAENRRAGLGALLGIGAGLGVGAMYGLFRPRLRGVPPPVLALGVGLAANVGTTGPMAVLGITDPRRWSGTSWASDLVPHLVYGGITAAVFDLMRRCPGR